MIGPAALPIMVANPPANPRIIANHQLSGIETGFLISLQIIKTIPHITETERMLLNDSSETDCPTKRATIIPTIAHGVTFRIYLQFAWRW